MTRQHRFMAIGTATAAAAILAGVAVQGASHPSRPSSSSTREEVSITHDLDATRDSADLLDWLATRTTPIVNGATAVRSTGQSVGRSSRVAESPLLLSIGRMQPPLQLRLPELNLFSGPYDVDQKMTLHLDPNLAKQASQDVVESLQQQQSIYNDGELHPPTRIPIENPLDWSVSPRALQRSSAG